MKNNLKRINL